MSRTIERARQEGSDGVIVIDNGSEDNILSLVSDLYGGFCSVIQIDRNIGSAGGFKAGFEEALKSDFDFVLLLDDDNCLEIGALIKLRKAFDVELSALPLGSSSGLIVTAFRSDHHPEIAMGFPPDRVNPRPSSYIGFHIVDLPRKLIRRIFPVTKNRKGLVEINKVELNFAPWGGLFFHRSLIGRFGFPLENFVLYIEDTEYTWRVTSGGGKIVLITSAEVEDIDKSWNVTAPGTNPGGIASLILGEGDFRVYYRMRNLAFFQRHILPQSFLKTVNFYMYWSIVFLFAVRYRRLDRWRLICVALRDGHAKRLGVSPLFPL
ncbi:glycosyltransferase [Rhodoferax aquaticus]|uniref:glycosyltransferase n=1 Tax=Rhodoferax aquaticus TaxID=2527691 RepID=UPI00143DA029